MARTKLSKLSFNPVLLKRIIDIRLKEISRDKVWLSVQTGINYRTLTDKCRTGNFDAKELFNIFYVTEMPQAKVLEVFGRENE